MLDDPRRPGDAIDFASLRRVLVIKLRHHGDVLLSAPVLSALAHAAPQAEVDALVYAETADMLRMHPGLRQLHTIDRNWKRQGVLTQVRAEAALLAALRVRHYDLIVHLTEHPRGAWLTRLLKPRWSVAPERAGAGRMWRTSFSHYYRLPGGVSGASRHTVEKNLDALRRLGLRPAPDRRVTLVPGESAEQQVRAALAEQGLLGKRFILIHPASRWYFKCWSPENMAALIATLLARGEHVVLSGAPDAQESKLLAAITGRLGTAMPAGLHDFSGKFSLKGLAALAAQACAFIGVDSAPMHIAAAMGTPTVALFGPSGDREWGPWQTPHRILTSSQHLCRPCGQDGCGGGKLSECLEIISVADVLGALQQLGILDAGDLAVEQRRQTAQVIKVYQ